MQQEIRFETPAIHIGVVFDIRTDTITRIIDPVYEEEFDIEPLADYEYIIRLTKKEEKLTLEQVYNLMRELKQE